MTDVELLVRAIEADPDDLVRPMALRDELMAARDMTPAEAERYVERVIQSARDARDIAHASELMSAASPHLRPVLDAIGGSIGATVNDEVLVVLVAGDQEPRVCSLRQDYEAYRWKHTAVTVGALWVTRYVDRNRHRWMPSTHKPKRRRRRH